MGLQDISNTITAELESGLSREEIFKKHTQSAPANAAKTAYCIASIPAPELRKRYLIINALLSLLLVAYAILSVLTELPINLQKPTIFILIKILFPLVFAYFVFRFHGGVYRLICILCLYDLAESILISGAPSIVSSLSFMVLFFIIALAFFIAQTVFPNLRILGPKKDSNGNYLL